MATGQDLATLRDRVDHLEGQIAYLYRHLGIAFGPGATPGDDPRIVEAIKEGNILQAIKIYREIYSTSTLTIGLDEAKAAVEEIKRRLRY